MPTPKVIAFRRQSTGKAACELGVHPTTLRRWARLGLIDFHVTAGGHFRWDVAGYLARQPSAATIGAKPQAGA